MPPSLSERLAHILQAIEDIRTLLKDSTRAEFASDIMLRLAVERLFEIISEASRFIPAELKAESKDIPWPRMADLGNWLRHAYHRVDPDILFNIVENDLEPLKQFVESVSSNKDPA